MYNTSYIMQFYSDYGGGSIRQNHFRHGKGKAPGIISSVPRLGQIQNGAVAGRLDRCAGLLSRARRMPRSFTATTEAGHMEARRKRFLHLRAERSGSGGNADGSLKLFCATRLFWAEPSSRRPARTADRPGGTSNPHLETTARASTARCRPSGSTAPVRSPCWTTGRISGAPVVLRKPEGPHKRQAFHGAAQGGRRIPAAPANTGSTGNTSMT